MGSVSSVGSAREFTATQGGVNTHAPTSQSPEKTGFQPRPAVLHSGAISQTRDSAPSSGLTNLKVTNPLSSKAMVTATEGYLTGTLEGGHELTIDIYQVYEQYRGRHLGQKLIEAVVNGFNVRSLRASMAYTNGEALRKAGGDVDKTPFGKAARALGFSLVDQEGSYFIYAK
jgi:hypothetical protein